MDSVTWVTYFGRKKKKQGQIILFYFFLSCLSFFYNPTAMEEIWNDYCNSNLKDKRNKKISFYCSLKLKQRKFSLIVHFS